MPDGDRRSRRRRKERTMLAYRLVEAKAPPEFQEVPEPHAGPGQVVVRIAGSGLCHTDFTVISRDRSYWKNEPPPFTLGHEIAGWRRGRDRSDEVPAWRRSRGQPVVGKLRPLSHVPVRRREPLPPSEHHSRSRRRLRRRTCAICPRSRREVSRYDRRSRPGPGRAADGCRHHHLHRH